MIIDFHTHIFSPAVKLDRSEYLADPCFAQLYSSPKAKIATAEDLVAAMDRDGVDVSVALNIGWTSHELCVESNSYLLEAAARYPDRLVAFCAVQPRAGEPALREVQRCAGAGARGIGEMRPDVQGTPLDDCELWAPLAGLLQELGLVFLTHASEPVGHLYPGKGSVTPEQLYRFICLFPGLTCVGAHWGGGLPFYALMPEVSSALQSAYFDTAASPYLYRPDIYGEVARTCGAGRVLLGSDYPLMAPSRLIHEVMGAELSADEKILVLGGNAERVLGWKKSAVSSPSSCPTT